MKKTIYKRPKSITSDEEASISIPEGVETTPDALIDVLKELQKSHGGLSKETLVVVSKAFNLALHQVNSVATFYSMLISEKPNKTIRVCDGPVCWLAGAEDVIRELQIPYQNGWSIERNSCLGLCDHAPAALLGDRQVGLLNAQIGLEKLDVFEQIESDLGTPLSKESRVLLADIDKIDPENIETAIGQGIFEGLSYALADPPEKIIEIIKDSDLVGRGGAGFPTGMKWAFVAGQAHEEKYIVCNADESEPLAVKDRVLIDRNPYLILAGMTIAGYAVGAKHGIIYIRGEYPAQATRLSNAIRQAVAKNFLGEDILGSGVNFHVHVHSGAGAYICGEETALLESLEGRRGEPRLRPPYPTTFGYKVKPTVVNNVETFANVPLILRHGSKWYRSLSESKFTGTKIYGIFGQVKEPRVFEAPFGISLSEMINDFGGGMLPGSDFGFALVGGAAGRFVPSSLLDLPLDYSSGDAGAHIGVGAALVCSKEVSPVNLLRELLVFFERESCGKCTPCRIGTHKSRIILDELIAGTAQPDALEELYRLSSFMGNASFCGLGISVPWPVLSALKHFRDDFEDCLSVGK